jgi:hypothetical protein
MCAADHKPSQGRKNLPWLMAALCDEDAAYKAQIEAWEQMPQHSMVFGQHQWLSEGQTHTHRHIMVSTAWPLYHALLLCRRQHHHHPMLWGASCTLVPPYMMMSHTHSHLVVLVLSTHALCSV